jgi:transglycosylase
MATQDLRPGAPQQPGKPHPDQGGKKEGKGRKKGNVSRARKIWGRIGIVSLVLFLIVGLSGIGTFMYLYATTKLPDPNSDFTTNTTFIYYNDGESQLGSLAVQNRVTLDYSEMPQLMKDAVVAAENSTFFTDPGISLPGMARGMWTILRGGDLQGGSTITQQYIKILYLDSERTASRKIRELILAMKMGREVPKEKILEGYLNTIYFGRGAYGIEAAAKSYFLKSASELTLPETATLAAILNNPAGLNPSGGKANRERLLGRYQYVLQQMLDNGYISQADFAAAHPALPEFPEVPVSDRYGGPKGHLISAVESELSRLGFSDAEIQGGGLKVITTLDQKMQDAAVEVAQKYTEQAANDAKSKPDAADLHAAISSVDTSTGGILAMYGGPDYTQSTRNWATTPRPAASTFKAFAAVAGLRNDYSLNSRLNGNTFTPRGEPVPIRNEFSEQYGEVTLRKAVAESINTAFVDMTQSMKDGPNEVIKAANDAGAPTGPGWDANNRVALGVAEVSPLDMANAYATFADSGKRKDVHIVAKVMDREGKVLHEAKTEGTQTIDENVAANVTDALTSVVSEGTGTKASSLKRPVAGKTGTNGVDDSITSAWFVGYTKQISTAVMYVAGDSGNENLDIYKKPGDKTFFGSGYPLMTWVEYMKAATEGQQVLEFDKPKPIKGKSPEPSAQPTQSPRVEETPQPTEEQTQPTEEPRAEVSSPQPSASPTQGRSQEPRPTTRPTADRPTATPTQEPIDPPERRQPSQPANPRPSGGDDNQEE